MGICASCLGLNRHPSREVRPTLRKTTFCRVRSRLPDRLTCTDQQVDESDPLLDDAQTVRYGAVGEDEVAQPDEEELEREREALNRITMQATESMIDVLHPNGVTINTHLTPNNSIRNKPDEASSQSTITTSNQAEDAEEQAWLDSITSTEPGSITHIKALQKGALVLDMGQLREAVPPPSARKSSRAGIGRV